MNNSVEYMLRARDMLSPVLTSASRTANSVTQSISRVNTTTAQGLNRLQATAQQTLNRVSSVVNNMTGRNRILGQSYDQLQERIRAVENTVRSSTIPSEIRAARRELEALERQSNRHMGGTGGGSSSSGGGLMGMMGGVGGMMKGAALGVGIGAIASLGGLVSDSISKGLERQQIQTSFNVLSGNEQAGGALTKQLVALQKDTILGGEVFKNAQTMMGFGFKSDEVVDNLKMIGDVSMGDANKLQSLTLAFSQTKAAGKLMGQDLLQYINAGFNPLEQMSQKTGKSIGQLKEDMEKGLIPFAAVQEAFKDATSEGGRFDNMLGKIADTPAGKVQQISGAWDEFKVSAGAAFMPLISMALDFASKVLPVIESVIAPLTTGVQIVVDWINQAKTQTGGWMDYVNIIRNTFMQHILPLVIKVWDVISGMLIKLYAFVEKSELLKDIFNGIYSLIGFVADAVGYLIDGLEWVFDNIVMPILNAIESAYKFIKGSADTGKAMGGAGRNWGEDKPISPQGITPSSLIQATTPPVNNTASNYNPNERINSAASAGSKATNINIVLNKEMVGSISIYPATMAQGTEDVKELIMQTLAQVLNSSNRLAID